MEDNKKIKEILDRHKKIDGISDAFAHCRCCSMEEYQEFWSAIYENDALADAIEDHYWNDFLEMVPQHYLKQCSFCGDYFWASAITHNCPACSNPECREKCEAANTCGKKSTFNIDTTNKSKPKQKLNKPDDPIELVKEIKTSNPNTCQVSREELSKDEYVYLMKSGFLHKIGITNNLDARIKSVAAHSPLPVVYIHNFLSTNNRSVERYLHKKYASCRSHYEWFNLSHEQVEEIKTIKDYEFDGLG